MLLQTCIDNNINIIINSDNVFANKPVLLLDDIKMNGLLMKKTGPTCNQVLIAVVCLYMLCYTQSKCLNILQKVNNQFTFANNVLKRFVKVFYHKSMIILYESICRGLNINTKIVMDTIVEKIWTSQFFVLYNNINVYEHTCNQKIYNQNALLNYTIDYIYFIKILESIDNSNNTWIKQYIE